MGKIAQCDWVYKAHQYFDQMYNQTSCGNEWLGLDYVSGVRYFNHEGPKWVYCPYCGREIYEVKE